ncbi:type I restriction enzyme endonuclease domain-containing protein [Candidatus Omnitrophota bacterium]
MSNGVDPKVPPLPIFSEKFIAKLHENKSDKARAEELEHAIDEHNRIHGEEDPELYERFAEKLEKLLKEYKQNWELLAKELETLLEEIKKGRLAENTFGLNPGSEMPFFGLIKKEVFGVKNISDLDKKQIDLLVQTTKDVLEIVRREVRLIDFWNNYTAQKKLKAYIISHLLTAFKGNKKIQSNKNALAQQILELAFHLNEQII